ncbi:MAG: hypothetical protein IPK55_10565 [Streptococcus sp.]|jgi:hypothetical protein|nr:hypothetical protein [Streptococcus sp.]
MLERREQLSQQLLDAKDCKFSNDSIREIFERYIMKDLTAAGRVQAVFDQLESNRLQRERNPIPWLDNLFKQTLETPKKNP